MDRLTISRYTPDMKSDWDRFVESSKNATFLLRRDYMDYHADRFEDHSLVCHIDGAIRALLPGCRRGETFSSHAGLTYGGLIMNRRNTTADTLRLMESIADHLRQESFSRMVYKPVPHIYHSLPAEEDLYALFRLGARLEARNVSSVIFGEERIKFRDIRKSGVRKARREGVTIVESRDYAPFWNVLTDNLREKYDAVPVHSLEEISLLSSRFPDCIRLFEAQKEGSTIGGAVIFDTPHVAHTQYISATAHGKECGALDLLFDTLVNDTFATRRYFDFGTSNEDNGKILNESLIYQKEGFGGRAICYDTYTIDL